MRSRHLLVKSIATLTLMVVVRYVGLACPSCFGDPDSSMTHGMNMAILSLLGITGSVLLGVLGFFVYVWRRNMVMNRRFKNMLN